VIPFETLGGVFEVACQVLLRIWVPTSPLNLILKLAVVEARGEDLLHLLLFLASRKDHLSCGVFSFLS